MLVELRRRSRGRPRAWRCHRIGELISAKVKTIETHAVALAPLEPVHGLAEEDKTKGWMTDKGWTTDKEETNTSRVRRRPEVSKLRNPTLGKVYAINFERDVGTYRANRTNLTVNGRLYVEREVGLLKEKNNVLPLRIETYKARNPKTRKLGLITHKAKGTKETERDPRGNRNKHEVAVSKTKKRIRPQAETVKKGDTRKAEWRNSAGETKVVAEKSKAESLKGESVPVEQVLGKGDSTARGGMTKSFRTARGEVNKSFSTARGGVTKSSSTTKGGETKSFSKGRGGVTKSFSSTRGGETKSFSTARGGVKKLTNNLSGIHQLNLSRYKSFFLSRKGVYYESPPYKRKQVNWEYAQMCMCDCKMIRSCMIDGNLKLCVWN